MSSVAETTYSHIRQFLDEDTHKTRKSKDVFECAARQLLAFHHRELGISIGLSYACNKQMSLHIQPPAKMPDSAIEEVTRLRSKSLGFPLAKYHDAIDSYVDCLKKHLYSKNIIKHAKRTCRLLYLFFDMHGTGYSLELGLLWLSELKPAFSTKFSSLSSSTSLSALSARSSRELSLIIKTLGPLSTTLYREMFSYTKSPALAI